MQSNKKNDICNLSAHVRGNYQQNGQKNVTKEINFVCIYHMLIYDIEKKRKFYGQLNSQALSEMQGDITVLFTFILSNQMSWHSCMDVYI